MRATVSSCVGLLIGIVLVSGARAAEGAAAPGDPWGPLRPLVGRWQGEGRGSGVVSDVTHEWRFVLQDRSLRLTTRSVQRTDVGPGELHEDVGYVSHDSDEGALVFRQFLSEGFVNSFEVVSDPQSPRTILLRHRASGSSGGMRVQMHLRFVNEDTFEMVLDLAAPGREFAACQRMRLKRVP